MANNYMQLSTSLVLNNDKERKWFEKYLPLINGDEDGRLDFASAKPLLSKFRKQTQTKLNIVHQPDLMGDIENAINEELTGPLCTIVSDPDNLDLPYVWIRDRGGEVGTLDSIVALIRIFLNVFDYSTDWSMEWAETCSKPRFGEFGGGAVIVTKEKTKWLSTSDWVRRNRKVIK